MPEIFLIIACILAFIVVLLRFAPQRRVLNFVDYGSDGAVERLNRYAAARLALPIVVNLGCLRCLRLAGIYAGAPFPGAAFDPGCGDLGCGRRQRGDGRRAAGVAVRIRAVRPAPPGS